MLARAVGLDQPDVEIEGAFGDRRAEIHGQRQRIARALRMVDQRAQDGRCRAAAELADKGPVIRAGPALPAAIAGGDPRGVIEQMRGFGEHGYSSILRGGTELPQGPSLLRAERSNPSRRKWMDGLLRRLRSRNDGGWSIATILPNSMTSEVIAFRRPG